jgi:hypothetical protein
MARATPGGPGVAAVLVDELDARKHDKHELPGMPTNTEVSMIIAANRVRRSR